jgi:hypothetical protein
MLSIHLAPASELQYPATDIFPTIVAETGKEGTG